jgi:hypothetical protein
MDNPINAMRNFFAHKSREVTLAEFTSFWKSLSEDDKNEFRTAVTNWDGTSEFLSAVKPQVLALPASTLAQAS